MKKILSVCVLLASSLSLWAMDFGVILDQNAGYGGIGAMEEGNADYLGSLIPRFSSPLGDGGNGDIYVSAGVSADYANDKWTVIPELLRTELTWAAGNWDIKAGRVYYADPLGFITEGLFDGLRFSYDTPAGTFSAGAWYTGLLYKKRAAISMNTPELSSYLKELDYADFADTYFAPRRLVTAADWEHPALLEGLLRARVSLMGQFDLTGESLNTQYLTGKVSLPLNAFVFDLGGSVELIQTSADPGIGAAAEVGAAWLIPGAVTSRVSLLGRYSTGKPDADGMVRAFLPVNSKAQGQILKPKLSGVSVASLAYLARLHRTLSAELTTSYFIRSDLVTYKAYFITPDSTEGYLLGNEFVGQLYWRPVSDVALNMGAGIFMPSLGNVAPKADNLWRGELNLVLSLY
jgi:hypothetical protein